MFSRKTVVVLGVVVLIIANTLILSVLGNRIPTTGTGRFAISLLAPFQEGLTRSVRFLRDTWKSYFDLVGVSRENHELNNQLSEIHQIRNQLLETELANERLRDLLNFRKGISEEVTVAEIIAKDPSSWFKTVIINKGSDDRLMPGLAVVVSDGIVGQVVETARHHAKVLLITDPNSAVDGLDQRTRVRGIIKGGTTNQCRFHFVPGKEDVQAGDIIVSSGLDGVYPKGLRVGAVTAVEMGVADIFQTIEVQPFVDFDKLEEVLILLTPRGQELGLIP
ncbi:MAG: rod shape-determining protein MreC [Desulfobacterales bacterium]|jgi:rod shape-determining protein MreC